MKKFEKWPYGLRRGYEILYKILNINMMLLCPSTRTSNCYRAAVRSVLLSSGRIGLHPCQSKEVKKYVGSDGYVGRIYWNK